MAAMAATAIYIVWLTAAVICGLLTSRRIRSQVDGVLPHGRAAWNGALMTSFGMAIAVLAVLLSVFSRFADPPAPLERPALQMVGSFVALGGAGATIVAQRAFGYHTELVMNGPFGWVRNPIYTAAMVTMSGLLFLVPSWLHLVGFASVVVGLEIKVRAVEEPYLLAAHGAAYAEYAASVGRFFPYVGLRKRRL